MEIPHQFFLLGIDGYDRLGPALEVGTLRTDVLKLRVPIRVLVTFTRFPHPLHLAGYSRGLSAAWPRCAGLPDALVPSTLPPTSRYSCWSTAAGTWGHRARRMLRGLPVRRADPGPGPPVSVVPSRSADPFALRLRAGGRALLAVAQFLEPRLNALPRHPGRLGDQGVAATTEVPSLQSRPQATLSFVQQGARDCIPGPDLLCRSQAASESHLPAPNPEEALQLIRLLLRGP